HEDEQVVDVEDAGLVVGGRLRPAGERELPPAALVHLEGNGRRLTLAEGEEAQARERRAAQVVELGRGYLEPIVGACDRAAGAERHGGIGRYREAAERKQDDERAGAAHQPRSTAVRVGAASARRHAASTSASRRRVIMRSVAASEGWSKAARLACASARSRRESARRAKRYPIFFRARANSVAEKPPDAASRKVRPIVSRSRRSSSRPALAEKTATAQSRP